LFHISKVGKIFRHSDPDRSSLLWPTIFPIFVAPWQAWNHILRLLLTGVNPMMIFFFCQFRGPTVLLLHPLWAIGLKIMFVTCWH
jgi:hypothetical protein